jgi:hypothetical protein
MVAARVILALSVVTATAVAQLGAREERIVPHVAATSRTACAQCHTAEDPRLAAAAPRGACDTQCAQCHGATTTAGHHPVGAAVQALASPALPRSSEGRIACRTCHDLTRPATDSVAWRSQSLYDAVFRRQARHRTYALALRNDKGQLCQSCH